jgi:D-alanine-D-alanine ligase
MKIGVIMGGVSSEYEVSLSTGSEIIENLYGIKHEVRPVIFGRKEELAEKVRGLDFVILALHGRFGEDGTVQGFLILWAFRIRAAACFQAHFA